MEKLLGGRKSASKSLINAFAEIKKDVPSNWRDTILGLMPEMDKFEAKYVLGRLERIYVFRTAPTTEEIELFKKVIEGKTEVVDHHVQLSE